MRVISIETTPNPNSMKLNFDQVLGKGKTYTAAQQDGCPESLTGLLDINGIQSIFVCHDFITLNRDPRSNWQPILETVNKLFGGQDFKSTTIDQPREAAEKEGQVSVFVQTFRNIPIQVKVVSNQLEKRISTGTRFNDAAKLIQNETGANYLQERYWADWGIRYGNADEIAAEIIDEITGTIDNKALEERISEALGKTATTKKYQSSDSLRTMLNAPDWHSRLKAVQEIGSEEEDIGLLIIALQDAHPQVRRLAAAALGTTGSAEATAPLCQTLLNDQSVGVRRTAGDALSDLGDLSAEPFVCRALADLNKLVRWRAARFLAEIGTKEALPYLIAALEDPEFEVRLEIEAAIQRISGGLENSAPAWKRILGNT